MNFKFNPRYPTPSEQVQEKIRLSFEEAENVGMRDMMCPVCKYKVTEIPLTQTEVVSVRCRKCKFEGPLSPAYFRRNKYYRPPRYYYPSGIESDLRSKR